jgi:hypothetical protein
MGHLWRSVCQACGAASGGGEVSCTGPSPSASVELTHFSRHPSSRACAFSSTGSEPEAEGEPLFRAAPHRSSGTSWRLTRRATLNHLFGIVPTGRRQETQHTKDAAIHPVAGREWARPLGPCRGRPSGSSRPPLQLDKPSVRSTRLFIHPSAPSRWADPLISGRRCSVARSAA